MTLTASDFNPFAEGEPVVAMTKLVDEVRGRGVKTGI